MKIYSHTCQLYLCVTSLLFCVQYIMSSRQNLAEPMSLNIFIFYVAFGEQDTRLVTYLILFPARHVPTDVKHQE